MGAGGGELGAVRGVRVARMGLVAGVAVILVRGTLVGVDGAGSANALSRTTLASLGVEEPCERLVEESKEGDEREEGEEGDERNERPVARC